MPDKKSKEELNTETPDPDTKATGVELDDTRIEAEDAPVEDSDIEDALILEDKVAADDATAEAEAEDAISEESASDAEEAVGEPEPLIWDAESAEADPQPEPAPAPVAAPSATQRSGMGPVLGGLLAAVVGFGGAWYLTSQGHLGGTASSDPAAESTMLADLEARMTAISESEQKVAAERIASLEAQIAELAGAAVPAEPDARVDNLLAAVSDLESAVRSQSSTLDGLQGEIETIATLPVAGGDVDQSEAMASLREALTAQRAENARIQAEVEKMTAGAASEVEAARAEAEALKAEAEALSAESQKVMQVATSNAAIARLEAALESGTPFDALLPDLEAAGAEVDPALASVAATGVSTLPALQAGFPSAARRGLGAARKDVVKAKPTERFTLFLKTHLGARSLEAVEGDNPDAILSRVGVAVRDGDLSTALTEVTALPQGGQDAMADWIGAAQARQDASAAAGALIASMNTN